jgi:hypothetical protein
VAAVLVDGDTSNAIRNVRHAGLAEPLESPAKDSPIKSFGCVMMSPAISMGATVALADISIQV